MQSCPLEVTSNCHYELQSKVREQLASFFEENMNVFKKHESIIHYINRLSKY